MSGFNWRRVELERRDTRVTNNRQPKWPSDSARKPSRTAKPASASVCRSGKHDSWTSCPICSCSLKRENVGKHQRRVHRNAPDHRPVKPAASKPDTNLFRLLGLGVSEREKLTLLADDQATSAEEIVRVWIRKELSRVLLSVNRPRSAATKANAGAGSAQASRARWKLPESSLRAWREWSHRYRRPR